LGRDGVRAEPGRDTAGRHDRAQLGQLRVAVEPVPGLRLERRRAGAKHPVAMAPDGGQERILPGLPGGANGCENPAARGVQLLVGRACRAQSELVDAVAGEAGVRVAVDEAGKGAKPTAVELFDVAVEGREVAHAADSGDPAVLTENVRLLEDIHLAERRAAKRSSGSGGRRELREVADQQPPPGGPAVRHSRTIGGIGTVSPCRSACSIASLYPASACRITPVPGSVVST